VQKLDKYGIIVVIMRTIEIPSSAQSGSTRSTEDVLNNTMWPLVDIGLPPEGFVHVIVNVTYLDETTDIGVLVSPAEDGSRLINTKQIEELVSDIVVGDKNWAKVRHLDEFGPQDLLDSNPQRTIY
jgi:hypothetical protein